MYLAYKAWEDNITTDLKQIGVKMMNWKELAPDTDNAVR